MQAFKEDTALTARLLVRSPGLPPDWHALSDPQTNRVYFYNSVSETAQWDPPPSLPVRIRSPGASSGPFGALTLFFDGLLQQLGGILQPLVTVGLYWCRFETLRWCARALFGGKLQLGAGTILFLSAAFFALPQPLPFSILLLSRSRYPACLGGKLASRVEFLLCIALVLSALPGLRLTLGVFNRAAEECVPKCRLPSWDCEAFTTLLIALCPALNWTLHPYALDWTADRVALLPLPFRVPLQVPVPRWEVLRSSWRAFLFAAPMVLPLARLLAAAAAAKPPGLSPGRIYALVICSRPVQMSAFVSVLEFLLERQGETYAAALEQKTEEEGAEVESLDRKMLHDFDRMLIDS